MTITFKNYEKLLKELKRFNYQFICSHKFNSFLNKEKMFILNKHDIERSTENALKAALIESRLQIQSTYFIHSLLPSPPNPPPSPIPSILHIIYWQTAVGW